VKQFLRVLRPNKIQNPLEPQKVLKASSQKMKQEMATEKDEFMNIFDQKVKIFNRSFVQTLPIF
jgi:hypothetical protein